MQTYEYKAVPAPNRSKRVKGVKGTAGRFAAVLSEVMNEQAKEGWEYLRSDSLPVEEKPGMFKSKVENYLTMLVFRRALNVEPEPVMAGYIEDQTEDLPPAPAPEPDPEETAPADPQIEPVVAGDWGEQNYRQDPPLSAPSESAEKPSSDSPFSEPQDEDPQLNR